MKVSKCRKFGDFYIENCGTGIGKFLKSEHLTENVSEFCVGRACK